MTEEKKHMTPNGRICLICGNHYSTIVADNRASKYWTLWAILLNTTGRTTMEQDAIDAIINDESVVFASFEDDNAAVRKVATKAYQAAVERGLLDEFLAECEDLAQRYQAYMNVATAINAPKERALRTFLEVLAELIDSDIQEAIKLTAIAVYVTNYKDDFEAI